MLSVPSPCELDWFVPCEYNGCTKRQEGAVKTKNGDLPKDKPPRKSARQNPD